MVFDISELKRLLSVRLLRLQGVSGVGIPQGHLTVYLKSDSSEVKRKVAEVVEKEAPGTLVRYELTGQIAAYRTQN